jgi:PAS domain S-box-containing protein
VSTEKMNFSKKLSGDILSNISKYLIYFALFTVAIFLYADQVDQNKNSHQDYIESVELERPGEYPRRKELFHKNTFPTSDVYLSFNIIKKESDELILSLLFIFLGIVFIYKYFKLSLHKTDLFFAFTAFCLSIDILYHTYTKALFFNFPLITTQIWILSIFYLPVAIFGTYWQLFGDGWKTSIKTIFRVFLTIAIAATLICFIDIIFHQIDWISFDLFPVLMTIRLVTLILALIAYLALVFDASIKTKSGDQSAKYFLIGLGLFLIFSLNAYLSAILVLVPKVAYLSHWGMVGFIIAMLKVQNDFSAQEKKAQKDKENELILAKIIQNIMVKESIVIIDLTHNIKAVNEKTTQITGYQADELINLHFSKLVLNALVTIEEINQLSKYDKSNFTSRLYYQRSDEVEISMDVTISMIPNAVDENVRILISGHEVEKSNRIMDSVNITKRENEVIHHIISGKTNKDIANSLNIKERTVKTHITHIYNKLGVSNKMQMLNIIDGYDFLPNNIDGKGKTEELVKYLYDEVIKATERFAQNEAIQNIDRLLKKIDQNDFKTHYNILNIREEIYQFLGKRLAQKHDIENMIQLAEKMSDDIMICRAILKQGKFFEMTGMYQDAIHSAERSKKLAFDKTHDELELESTVLIGKALWRQGEYKESQKVLQRGIKKSEELPNHSRNLNIILGYLYLNLGITYDFQGDHSTSKAYLEQAIEIFRNNNYSNGEADAMNNLGIIAFHREEYINAESFYKNTLAIYEDMNAVAEQVIPMANLGEVYWMQHDYFKSFEFNQKALELSVKLQFRSSEFYSRFCLSMLANLNEDYAIVSKNLSACLRLSKQIGDKALESMALARKAQVEDTINREPENLVMCKLALKQAHRISALREASMALSCLGELYLNRKKYRQAIHVFSKSLKLRLKLGQKILASEAKTEICNVHLITEKYHKAYETALEIADFLTNDNLSGTEKPLWMFYTCYRALYIKQDPLAEKILNQAYDYLRMTTDKIHDEAFKKRYLQVSYINALLNLRNRTN